MGRLMLNCDLGENEAPEQTVALIERIDAANICCGYHAGNEGVTRRAIEQAKSRDVRIGAHPGLAAAGGRGTADVSVDAFNELLRRQLNHFRGLVTDAGAEMDYVKLHGSLYHAVEIDERLAEAYIERLREFKIEAVMCLAGACFAQLAQAAGLTVYQEAFADRGYLSHGGLVPRGQSGALLGSVEAAVARVREWRSSGQMPAVDGTRFELRADTLCVHGDSPGALPLLDALAEIAGVDVA